MPVKQMSEEKCLLIEYDDIMAGNKKGFSSDHFGKKTSQNCCMNARVVIRYAFDTYLFWDRKTLYDRLDLNLMNLLHLRQPLNYIDFPIEYNKDEDFFYLISLLYDPKSLGIRLRTLHLYEKILAGKIQKFPKEYFTGAIGKLRACICLQYAVNLHFPYMSPARLYAEACKKTWISFLVKMKLDPICSVLFADPVEFLHASLPTKEKDEFAYHYFRFRYYHDKLRREDAYRQKAQNNCTPKERKAS